MAVPPANFTDADRRFAASPWMIRLRTLFSKISIQRRERSLQVCETLSLGDRRFLAIVRCGEQRLLIGMAGQNICLLDRLPGPYPSCDLRGREFAANFADGLQ